MALLGARRGAAGRLSVGSFDPVVIADQNSRQREIEGPAPVHGFAITSSPPI